MQHYFYASHSRWPRKNFPRRHVFLVISRFSDRKQTLVASAAVCLIFLLMESAVFQICLWWPSGLCFVPEALFCSFGTRVLFRFGKYFFFKIHWAKTSRTSREGRKLIEFYFSLFVHCDHFLYSSKVTLNFADLDRQLIRCTEVISFEKWFSFAIIF